jgi:hypothetical protein
MNLRIRNASGGVMLLSSFSAMAQEVAALKASGVAACASCPNLPGSVTPPGDPTMLIAGAFILGVLVGVVAVKVFGNKKQQ